MIEGKCHCGNVKWSYPLELESVTACNCSLCSRYGAMWAYGHLEDGIQISGPTKSYEWGHKHSRFNFCTNCGCLAYYIANKVNEKGHRRIAVNIRMAMNPDQVQHLLIDHFDGKDTFDDLPRDGRTVKDLWF